MTPYRARASRPLRATGLLLASWVTMRLALLWPEAAPPFRPAQPMALRIASARADAARGRAASPLAALPRMPGQIMSARRSAAPVAPVSESPASPVSMWGVTQLAFVTQAAPLATPLAEHHPVSAPPLRRAPNPNRLSASGWLLVRSNRTASGLAPSGTLGGSQAGLRLFYEPGPRGLAVTARLSTPLGLPKGREVTLGLAYRRGAVGANIEQRIALDDGGRTAPSFTLFGGLYDRPLLRGWRASGFVQAGVVGVRDAQGFADGELRIEHPVVAISGATLFVGVAGSGGAQPGLARLDIGPHIALKTPVAGGMLRIAAGWRSRIAGDAMPGSGPVLTAGVDF